MSLGILHRKNQVKWLFAGGRDGQWMHKTHENGEWGYSPYYINAICAQKKLSSLVCVNQW